METQETQQDQKTFFQRHKTKIIGFGIFAATAALQWIANQRQTSYPPHHYDDNGYLP